MSATEQRAGAMEREAVERIATFLGWSAVRVPEGSMFADPEYWGAVNYWRTSEGAERACGWSPFRYADDERELLTAVQERWGRHKVQADCVDDTSRRWATFTRTLDDACRARADGRWYEGLDFVLVHLAPGDIARAVDAVLREYPE